MKLYSAFSLVLLGCLSILASCKSADSDSLIQLEQTNDSTTIVHIKSGYKYLLLPVEEASDESQVCLYTGDAADTDMDVRLSKDSIDYYVPFELNADGTTDIRIMHAQNRPMFWDSLQVSNTFDNSNHEKFRPLYHHTPSYGWMNDANGLVFKDGVFHLAYQYNPYGARWGNMHWGHATSTDLFHWEEQKATIKRDTMGHIFSGSCVVDANNTAGYGPGAIVAFYTSANYHLPDGGSRQIQCMAYSTDGGYTYTKYDKNPILTSELKDFRDPKVFWYEPQQKWVMIVSADKEMRFYDSKDLKAWRFMSAFGQGYGAMPCQFECPEMVQLPVDGDSTRMKWALIVNINPGCYFGGSATEYFIGDFDGEKFTCDTKPEVIKWLDWGKDHYATVCFSNTGDRTIAMPWMSNWQYANLTPSMQFRGTNALPRELSLFSQNGDIYIAAAPIQEVESLRKESKTWEKIDVTSSTTIDNLLDQNDGAYEIDFQICNNNGHTNRIGLELSNARGEKAVIYLDSKLGKLVMDRTESGITTFGKLATPHEIENHDRRKTTSINYQDDFALATWAPINTQEKKFDLRIFVDKTSIEIFVNNGQIAMTNLVFPNEPYNTLRFFSEAGSYEVKNLTVYRLAL